MKKVNVFLFMALILTLPLRGFAAPMIVPASGHDHHSMMMLHAGMEGMSAMDHHDHGTSGHHQHMPSKGAMVCDACGACCTGAMPASLFSSISSVIPVSAQEIPFISQPYNGFIPEGPERPPRFS